MRKKRSSYFVVCLLLTIIMIMVFNTKVIMDSVTFSISIWKDNLFPSLFPFFIVSNLLLQYGFVEYLGTFFRKIMPSFFHLPGEASFVLIISLFSGFPSGAKYTTELVNKKQISVEDGERLLTFTHYSNPLFILGMIGSSLLGSRQLGFLILGAHVMSGLIVGFIFRPKKLKEVTNKLKLNDCSNESISFGVALRKSIFDALDTMFLLLGIVTIFLIVTTVLNVIIPLNVTSKTMLSGLLEMTQGVKLVNELPLSLLIKSAFMTFFISFGGISVHMQVLSIISEAKIKYKYFFLARLLHAILAVILVLILYNFI